MAIAKRLKWYLDVNRLSYEVVDNPPHDPPEQREAEHAPAPEPSDISADHIARCVVLDEEGECLMAVLPASRRLSVGTLNELLHRHYEVAPPDRLREVFFDCKTDAIPPVGSAYGVPTVFDDSLLELPDVYFEAGDRDELVHMSGGAFLALLESSGHGRFSRGA